MRKFCGVAAGAAAVAGVGAGAGTAAAEEFSLSARSWMLFDNIDQRQSSLQGFWDAQDSWDLDLARYSESINDDYGDLLAGEFAAIPTLQDSSTTYRSTQLFYPLNGVSASVPLTKNLSLSATMLYGKGHISQERTELQVVDIDVDFADLGFANPDGSTNRTVQDVFSSITQVDGRFERIDMEMTLQYRLNETYSLMGGVRLEGVDFTYDSVSEHFDSANYWDLTKDFIYGIGSDESDTLPEDRIRRRSFSGSETETYYVYTLRFGGAAYAPVSENQVLYVNGFLNVSQQQNVIPTGETNTNGEATFSFELGETSMGPDISVGYMYRLFENVALDLRYRGAFSFTIDGDTRFEDPRINHGLNVGLTLWF